MNRRTFNTTFGGGATTTAAGAWLQGEAPANPQIPEVKSQPTKWPGSAYRRLLVDTHVPDWDPHLLANFDAAEYVHLIARAGFQSVMQYANSHVGLCLWRTKVGQQHAAMKGRDYFGDVMRECRRYDLHTVAYYSLIFDIWAFEHHPDWRILPDDGCDRILSGRTGVVCPNSPYRDHALACLRELVANYDFVGIFLDMTFWPEVCYCPHCTARFWREHNAELPRIVDWDDAGWRRFQKARQQWLLEFAKLVTSTIKQTRPISVYHQFSTIFSDWRLGVPLELKEASDFAIGDFYGGPTQYSLVCKAYAGLTASPPFELATSRTIGLGDFETIKPFEELLVSTCVATLHSAACLLIDAINPDGTVNHAAYDFMGKVNAQRAPYEPFLGGDLLADVALYFDRESMYDPRENGTLVSKPKESLAEPKPHLAAVLGAARILRQAHIPYGVVTNANLEQLGNYRAVIVPSVFEMTAEQAARFRKFVEDGGVLYASGTSSLDRFASGGPRFMLEDVLGVRYKGRMGTTWSYLTPQDDEMRKVIWPQAAFSFAGPMIQVEALPGSEVLATVTLPFVPPEAGKSIGAHFAQIWSNPPALTPGADPGIVIHSLGRGKAVWVSAPVESVDHAVNAKLVVFLLRRVLPGPFRFEADTHPSVEMTLFHQPEERRLLAGLLNLQQELPLIPVGATVRVQLPSERRVSEVVRLPDRKAIPFQMVGPYVQFRLEPFERLAMALVEYR